MLYDIQIVVRDKDGFPGLQTDLVSGSPRRIYGRVREISARKQQCRVWGSSRLLSNKEIKELDR